MGKEYFFQFCAPHRLEELGITKLSSFRRYVPVYQMYEFGTVKERYSKDDWPDVTICPTPTGFTLCVYHASILRWKEILVFLRKLLDEDPNLAVKEDTWEEDIYRPFTEYKEFYHENKKAIESLDR